MNLDCHEATSDFQPLAVRTAEAVAELDATTGDDPAVDHREADDTLLELLRDLGAGAAADAYKLLVKRCRWWAFA